MCEILAKISLLLSSSLLSCITNTNTKLVIALLESFYNEQFAILYKMINYGPVQTQN